MIKAQPFLPSLHLEPFTFMGYNHIPVYCYPLDGFLNSHSSNFCVHASYASYVTTS